MAPLTSVVLGSLLVYATHAEKHGVQVVSYHFLHTILYFFITFIYTYIKILSRLVSCCSRELITAYLIHLLVHLRIHNCIVSSPRTVIHQIWKNRMWLAGYRIYYVSGCVPSDHSPLVIFPIKIEKVSALDVWTWVKLRRRNG